MVKVVTRVIKAYNQRYSFPLFKYPSIRLFPVTLVYLIPNSKKGYLRMLARMIGMIIIQPYCAPALVDNTRWDVPMAILAKRSPGPRFLSSVLNFDINAWFVRTKINFFSKQRCLPYFPMWGKSCVYSIFTVFP